MSISIWEMTPQFMAAIVTDLLNAHGQRVLESPVTATLDDVTRAELFTAPGVGRVEIRQGERVRTYEFTLTETTARVSAPVAAPTGGAAMSELKCVFCARIEAGEFETTIDDRVVTFEPLNPVTEGHRLFVPREHAPDPGEDWASTGQATAIAAFWGGQFGDAFNLITSAGHDATQTIRHTHIHYVPRHADDGLHLPWTGQKPDGGDGR